MSLAVQVVFTGLSAGGVYGLIAIGHSLIYRLTGIVHFALGDLIGLGAFITLLVAAGTQPLTQETVSGGRMALAIVAGVVACVVVGAAGYFAVVQPYIGRSAIGWVAATLALGFAIHAVLDAAFSRPAYVFPDTRFQSDRRPADRAACGREACRRLSVAGDGEHRAWCRRGNGSRLVLWAHS
jgi:branched-chain amino acid transport system permease protein